MDPMWLIQATDGVTYYVGQDLKVYVYADLPFSPPTSRGILEEWWLAQRSRGAVHNGARHPSCSKNRAEPPTS